MVKAPVNTEVGYDKALLMGCIEEPGRWKFIVEGMSVYVPDTTEKPQPYISLTGSPVSEHGHLPVALELCKEVKGAQVHE